MKGLYLQGGGAKGAFQAGVITALDEKGIVFDVIAGTSVGAFNGYFIYSSNISKLRDVWYNPESLIDDNELYMDVVCDNSAMMRILKKLNISESSVQKFFVNYVDIKNYEIQSEIVDIVDIGEHAKFQAIRYSSLLPIRMNRPMTYKEILREYNSNRIFSEFKEDFAKGVYEGYKLDGGITNNNMLEPFIKNRVDELYIITLENDYKLPDYILDIYDDKDIHIIKPNTELGSEDMLRFEEGFTRKLYDDGYVKGINELK